MYNKYITKLPRDSKGDLIMSQSKIIVVCRKGLNVSMEDINRDDIEQIVREDLHYIEYITNPLFVDEVKDYLSEYGDVKDENGKTFFNVSTKRATDIVDETLAEVKKSLATITDTTNLKDKYQALWRVYNSIKFRTMRSDDVIVCEVFEDDVPEVSYIGNFIEYAVSFNVTEYEVLGGFFYKE